MSLLTSLAIGIALIIGVFLVFIRIASFTAKQAAVILAILTLGFYTPVAIHDWPGADVFAIHLALYLITTYGLGMVGSGWEKGAKKGNRFHWGPAAIVGFFAVVIAMDAIFITVAQRGLEGGVSEALLPEPRSGGQVTSFFPGTVTYDFQEKEDQFNQYKDRLENQAQRDWTVRKGWLEQAVAGEQTVFQVTVLDEKGQPITDAEVDVLFWRPADQRLDRRVTLNAMGNGSYRQVVQLEAPGRWQADLRVRTDESIHQERLYTEVQPGSAS